MFQLDDVYEGKAVRFDWKSALKEDIKTRHSTIDGKPMIHLGHEPLVYSRHTYKRLAPSSVTMGKGGKV